MTNRVTETPGKSPVMSDPLHPPGALGHSPCGGVRGDEQTVHFPSGAGRGDKSIPRVWRHWQRNTLLWGLASFLLLQLSLAIAIDKWLPELRDPEYGNKLTHLRRRTAVSPKPLTVVMLGSSRINAGFQAGPVEADLSKALGQKIVVYNFGVTGAGPLSELIDLKRLLAVGIHPDLILVEVLSPLLASQVTFRDRMQVDRLCRNELDLMARYGGCSREMRTDWWERWSAPWYWQRFKIINQWMGWWLPFALQQRWCDAIDDTGYLGAPVVSVTHEEYRKWLERAREDYRDYLTGFRIGGLACQALEEILETCRQHRIPTALVVMPEGSEFRSWYSPEAMSQIDGFLRDLTQKYDSNLIDARAWMPDSAFMDSHHLLPHGAAAFSKRFGQEGILPLLLPQPSYPSGDHPVTDTQN